MSSISQQFTAADGDSYEYTDYNGEIGNIVTNINNIYGLVDDNTGSAPITVNSADVTISKDSLIIDSTGSAGLNVVGNAGNAGIEVRAVGGTPYVDFSNDSSTDYDARLSLASNDVLALRGADLTISEGKALNIKDSTGTYTSTIYTDSSGNLITSVTSPGIAKIDNTDLVVGQGKALKLYNGLETKNTGLYTDSNGNYNINPYADGNVVAIRRMPRSNNGSSTYIASVDQRGWGYIQGDGSTMIDGNFNLPFTFSNLKFSVSVTYCGYKTSAPSDESDFVVVDAESISTKVGIASGGNIYVQLYNNLGNFSSGRYYGFHILVSGAL